ncbi:MAG: glycosyltransferase family 2 protein [Bacteroidales bacterium]|nr:glycosyltransferase family 2 protein [Bacteroidales bacterium]
MNNSITISIIIPIYNTEKYLAKCLDSILAQTFDSWEAILVDDGSKDGSGKICDDYVAKDSRFKVIHKQNEGVSIARLTAYNHCSGEFVTFVDSDDYITNNMLEKMYSYIQEYNVDMVVCKNFDVYHDRIEINNRKLSGYFDRDAISKLQNTKILYDYNLGMAPIIEGLARRIIRKQFLKDSLKKSVGYWLGEDAICNLYLYDQIGSMYISDDCLYYYVHHEGAATQSNPFRLWNGLEKLFDGITDLNHDGIYDSQLPGKAIVSAKICLLNSCSLSFSDFKKLMAMISDSKFVKKYLIHNKTNQLSLFKDKFTLFVVKSKFILLTYLLVKLFLFLKK